MKIQSEREDSLLGEPLDIIDAAWKELQRSPYVQLRMGAANDELPDVSFVEAERRSGVGQRLLQRLDALDLGSLPHDVALTLRLVRFRARIWAREAEWYWTALDPSGIGLFGMFLPTAYCGGFLLNLARAKFLAFALRERQDADRYHTLLDRYGRLIDQFALRTAGQAERGLRMPKTQVLQARTLLRALRSAAHGHLPIRVQHRAPAWMGKLAREVEERIATHIQPAFQRAQDVLSDAYLAQAPETVGMGQYAGAEGIYAELVKLHTTLDLTPEQVHSRGLERMAEIEQSVGAIQAELGFDRDHAGFLAHLNDDPQWRASTVEGVAAVFQRYIDRLEDSFNDSFVAAPKASYGVAPLPEALQPSMTYGYYDPPRRDREKGVYFFNTGNLTQQPLYHIGALTYHELMPGHHLQFAAQQENAALHPFRAHSFVNAYIEGWAEYAATWAGEVGLYESPQERYGRLVMDAFLTSRLVVDTGMNILGWSLERARAYMREHSRLTEAEILTESLRYSCDIPAQALAYKLGDTEILSLREKVRNVLRTRFNLRNFHATILNTGALPLPDLAWHIEQEIHRGGAHVRSGGYGNNS